MAHKLDFQLDDGRAWEQTPISLTVTLEGLESYSQTGNMELGFTIAQTLANQNGCQVRFVYDQQPGTTCNGHYRSPQHNPEPKRKGRVMLRIAQSIR
jgi:hypothetical protein